MNILAKALTFHATVGCSLPQHITPSFNTLPSWSLPRARETGIFPFNFHNRSRVLKDPTNTTLNVFFLWWKADKKCWTETKRKKVQKHSMALLFSFVLCKIRNMKTRAKYIKAFSLRPTLLSSRALIWMTAMHLNFLDKRRFSKHHFSQLEFQQNLKHNIFTHIL